MSQEVLLWVLQFINVQTWFQNCGRLTVIYKYFNIPLQFIPQRYKVVQKAQIDIISYKHKLTSYALPCTLNQALKKTEPVYDLRQAFSLGYFQCAFQKWNHCSLLMLPCFGSLNSGVLNHHLKWTWLVLPAQWNLLMPDAKNNNLFQKNELPQLTLWLGWFRNLGKRKPRITMF